VKARLASVGVALGLAVLAVVVVRSSIGPAAVADHHPPAHGTADMYLSPTGNDRGQCGRRDPCKSLNRAYQTARPGQVVELASGVYPDETLSASGRTAGRQVVFQAAHGARVRTGEVRIDGAAGIEFRGITMASYYVAAGSRNITFLNVRAHFFFVRSASRISILGGSIGDQTTAIPATIGSTYRSTAPSREITIDGVTFHDMTRAADPSGHPECLFVQSVDGFILRNSRFLRCDVFDLYANNIGDGPQLRDMQIEDNFFGIPTDAINPGRGGWYSLYISNSPEEAPMRGLLLRNNSFAKGFHLQAGRYVDSRVVANVSPLDQSQCTRDGILWAYNVFSAAACGPADLRAAPGFVDPATGDLHLRPGAAAVGFDRAGSYPAADIDGDPRPQGGAVDAGADEWTPASDQGGAG
jgi:hypothetical protein